MVNSISVSFKERADYYEMEYAAKLGGLLPDASAKAFEKVLLLNPNDLVNRARLLGYYWKYYKQLVASSIKPDPEKCAKRVEHILWFIENASGCIFAGNFYFACDPNKDPDSYKKVKSAWENQLKHDLNCSQSRVNFAFYLLDHDPKFATNLLLEVRQIEPLNEWALSLLHILGHETGLVLPLPIYNPESQLADEILESRVNSTEQMLDHWSFGSAITKSTVDTQELVLKKDHLDIWARLDILRWCETNMERANRLGFDPAVAQRWYRHALWILRNAPHIKLILSSGLYVCFGEKIPTPFFTPVREAFIEAVSITRKPVQVLHNAINFLKQNLGIEETKKLIFPLQAWKNLAQTNRQKLLKELNWTFKIKTIFEKNLDLNSCSVYNDLELQKPSFPSELSMWADSLSLSKANYLGYSYSTDCARNLEAVLTSFQTDLISTARLYGYYSRRRQSLDSMQFLRYQEIMKWFIENVPDSDFVSEVRIYENDDEELLKSMRTLWQKQIEKKPKNSLVATNAASWLAHCDNKTALEIAKNILEYEPENIFAVSLVYGLSADCRNVAYQLDFHDPIFEAECDKRIRNFPEIADRTLATICDKIELYIYGLLYCLRLPLPSFWSNEQALKLNPNDAILRCEVLGRCNLSEQLRRPLIMLNPELARLTTRHILWLIENVPHADLHFFIRHHEVEGVPSHKKILAKAVKAQRKIYGKTVAAYRPQFPKKKKS